MKNFLSLGFLFLFPGVVSAQEADLEATFDLRNVNEINVPFQNSIPYSSFEKQNHSIINLGGTWKKQRFSASDVVTLQKRNTKGMTDLLTESAGRETENYDDSAWETKTLPQVENIMDVYQKRPEYYEDGVWYRKAFSVSSDYSGKRALLRFLAVNYVADVWVNGNYCGWHEGGYTPFAFDVTPFLKYGEANTISVRIDNPEWGKRNDIVPYVKVDWFNYTGIIHDVYMEFVDPVSVSRADIADQSLNGNFKTKLVLWNPEKKTDQISVSVKAFEVNLSSPNIQSDFVADLLGSQINISGTTEFNVDLNGDSVVAGEYQFSITSPKLWTIKKPSLYALKVTLKSGKNILDEFYTQFGIRTVATNGNKIELNGIPTFFTAVARHEDHPVYGRSIPKNVIYSDLKMIKGVNANLVRTAHYPNHPYTYQVLDRLGVAAIEEIPVWWFDTEAAWKIQNERRHIHEQMWREMIFRDYNRPSILLWSTTNECLDVANRKIFIEKVHHDLDTNYPDGRLVTQSAAADRPGPNDDSQYAVDVPGWTMYFGVFYGNEAYPDTKAFLEATRSAHPNTPIIATEYGRWSKEDHTQQGIQNVIFSGTYDAFSEFTARSKQGVLNTNGHLAVTTWWCLFDWYTHTQPTGFQSMGLYQMNRTSPKEVADILKGRYSLYNATAPINTDIEDEKKSELDFRVNQNYPNPFNPSTHIDFELPGKSQVTVSVFDLEGRLIKTIFSGVKNAGKNSVEFSSQRNGLNLASGIYLYKIQTDFSTETKKMILVK